MNRTCPRDEALSALVDDALGAEARSQLLAHSAICPLCKARLVELRALHDAFAALPALSLQIDLAPRVLARLQDEAKPAAGTGRHIRWPQRLMEMIRRLTIGRIVLSRYAGATAAIGLGLWLGGMLVQLGDTASPPASNATLAAASFFGSIPPGNLCPRAGACGAPGSSQ